MPKEINRSTDNSNQPLNLRINGRFLAAPNPTGVQRWASEVLIELQARSDVALEIIRPKSFFKSGVLGHLWEQFILPMMGDRQSTLVSLANWGPLFTSDQLLVVHDLIPLKNPSLFKKSYALACKILLPKIIRRSRFLCVPSLATVNDLSASLGILNERVTVVGAGIRFHESTTIVEDKFAIRGKYFVFLGGFSSRKNLDFLLKLWGQLNDPAIKLVVVTRSSEGVTAQASKMDLYGSVVFVPDPDDHLLFALYANSIALLFPSLSEGFGLPLLEVMSTGKPFISNQVGVAVDLCTGDSRVLELEQRKWLMEIERLASKLSVYDERQISLAREYTWGQVADRLVHVMRA